MYQSLSHVLQNYKSGPFHREGEHSATQKENADVRFQDLYHYNRKTLCLMLC